MPVRIVTDSSSDLTEAQATDLGIEVVPLSIRFGDDEFVDRTELTVDEFYRRYLEALLEAHDNNISAAARAAGIERMSIYKMIRRLGLDKTEARNGNGDDERDDESTDHHR